MARYEVAWSQRFYALALFIHFFVTDSGFGDRDARFPVIDYQTVRQSICFVLSCYYAAII